MPPNPHTPLPFILFFINLFIYLFWLCWVFVSVRGLSLVAASGGHSSSQCVRLSLSRPLLLRSTGSRRAGSVVVAHGPSRSAACGIFPDQGSNPCPLHWQADSQPLRHQGSPPLPFNGWQILCTLRLLRAWQTVFPSQIPVLYGFRYPQIPEACLRIWILGGVAFFWFESRQQEGKYHFR